MRSSSITENLASRLLSVLFPPVCLACGQVEGSLPLDLGLCSRCHAALRSAAADECPNRGMATGSRGIARANLCALCAGCRECRPPDARLLAAWSFEPPFDRVIHALKFNRLVYLGDHLARHLVERFGGRLADCDLVVPLPLHWSRRLARGYNQAEEIARPLSRRLGLPMVHGLRRIRPTRTQTRLDRAERAANLRGAFRPVRADRLRSRTIVLVDDVVTTGATLSSAAGSLRAAGAEQVVAVAAGKTPMGGR